MNLKIKKEKYKNILRDYLKLKSCDKVAKKYSCEGTTIANIVKLQGLDIRHNDSRKYYFNQDFFSQGIINHPTAYIFGLLLADGCNTGKTVVISLQNKDKYILKKIQFLLNKKGSLFLIKRKKAHHKLRLRLDLNSKRMSNDLIKLGMVPNKSLILKFPDTIIPEQYMSSFIRGYFDGDGGICITNDNKLRTNITSSTVFCQKLATFLNKLDIKTRFKNYINPLSQSIEIPNNNDNIKFYNYIYQNLDNNLFLTRKKEKFEKWAREKKIPFTQNPQYIIKDNVIKLTIE